MFESLLNALKAGADDFISKPFDRYELRARLLGITRLNRYQKLLQERVEHLLFLGLRLLDQALFAEIQKGDFHAIVAGISLPNDPSVRLHEKFGMEKIAHFREVGRKFNQWLDVVLMQRMLN